MGALDSIAKLFKRDKAQQIAKLGKGNTMDDPAYGGSGIIAGGAGANSLTMALSMDQQLLQRYADYENMDDYPELQAALDIYADDTTITDNIRGKTIWGESKDLIIRDIIDDCLHRRLRIEEEIWLAMRTLGKYGNVFAETVVTDAGVVGLNFLPTPTIRRLVDMRGNTIGFVQDLSGQFGIDTRDFTDLKQLQERFRERQMVFFEPWEIVHWRLQSKFVRSIYGYSILDAARWIWKRLQMLEDTALVYKLTRSPGRYAFYVDTGDLPPDEAMSLLKKVMKGYKKRTLLNPTTGQLEFRMNPLCLVGDTMVPLVDGRVLSITDIVGEYNSGKRLWVHSVWPKDGKLLSMPLTWAGKTRENAELVKITLDNSAEIRCTPDHCFPLKDGTKVAAADLSVGDSLIPFRRHRDRVMGVDGLDGHGEAHRVVSVEHLPEREDTYTLTVNGTHTFALDAGVFTFNSPEEDMWIPTRGGKESTRVDVLAGPDWQCLAGDTPIPLMDGTTSTIEDLSRRKDEFWLYSMNEKGEVVPGKGYSARKTKKAEVLEVELDNGEVVRCSDNHPFMLRDGTWLRADQLVQGCSLMPMYSEISSVESGDRIDGYEKVFDPASLNHKVVAVRRTGEEEWLYDLTVDEYHNFAIGQGVFVHNSMEDIEYFRDKMFTAIKIPRSYYGGDAEAEAGLAQKDVRFARTCMRIQREFRNGIRQVLRVHMAALGIDPDSIPWDTRMTTPSSIFELQQIEVMNAQAGLISSLSEHFPEPWLLERVLHLSQDEAVRTKAEKDSEREKSINDNARIEATIQAKYPGVDVGANGEMGVAEEGVDVSKKLNKLMESIKETRQTSDRVLKRIGEMEPKLEKSIKRADALARTALRKVQ